MKRIITLFLIFALVFGSLACSNSVRQDTVASQTEQTQKEPEKERSEENAPKAAETEKLEQATKEPTQEPTEKPTAEVVTEAKEFDKSATIEETILFDDQGIKITATGLSFERYYGAVLSLIIENSNDFDVTVLSGSTSFDWNYVNGYMASGYVHEKVAAGKKAMTKISFDLDELKLCGINGISEFGLAFLVQKEDYSTLLETGLIVLKTSFEASDDSTFKEMIASNELQKTAGYTVHYLSTDVSLESRLVKLKSVSLLSNQNGEQSAFLEIENLSENPVYVQVRDTTVNGLQLYSGLWSSKAIAPGKTRVVDVKFQSMTYDKNVFDLLGIQTVSSMEIQIDVANKELESMETNTAFFRIADKDITAINQSKELYSDNDIQISYLGTVKDEYSFSDDLYLVFFVTNLATEDRYVRIKYNSLSVNGFMADSFDHDGRIGAEKTGLLVIDLYDPEKIQITNPEDIEEIEFSVEVLRSNYKKIGEGTVFIMISE